MEEEKTYPKNITVYDEDYITYKQLHSYFVNKYGKRIKMKTIFNKMVSIMWKNKTKIVF